MSASSGNSGLCSAKSMLSCTIFLISSSIAAASILAKTTRDAYMVEADTLYPGYGFARHKGYGTPEHLEALARLGPCPLHRRSYAPVRAAAGGSPTQGDLGL